MLAEDNGQLIREVFLNQWIDRAVEGRELFRAKLYFISKLPVWIAGSCNEQGKYSQNLDRNKSVTITHCCTMGNGVAEAVRTELKGMMCARRAIHRQSMPCKLGRKRHGYSQKSKSVNRRTRRRSREYSGPQCIISATSCYYTGSAAEGYGLRS